MYFHLQSQCKKSLKDFIRYYVQGPKPSGFYPFSEKKLAFFKARWYNSLKKCGLPQK